MSEEKENGLKAAVAALIKEYGEDAIMIASQLPDLQKVLLGIPMFDYVTDGGIPINRVIEVYGPYSSLKSYLCLLAIAAFQRYDWGNHVADVITGVELRGKRKSPYDILPISDIRVRRGYKPKNDPEYKYAVLLDMEGSYDPAWGAKLGVDNDMLIHIRPSSLNQGIDMYEAICRSEQVGFGGIDSMIASGSDGEIDKSMEDDQMAINARFWSKAARKIKAAMNTNKNLTVFAVNGYYDKVGLVFGNPEKVKNGNQFSLLKDISLRLYPHKEIKVKREDVEEIVGRHITLDNKKNKCGRPFLSNQMYFTFIDDGDLKAGETDIPQQFIDLGFKFGLITKRGAWVQYNDISISGMENFRNELIRTEALVQLKKDVYANIGVIK